MSHASLPTPERALRLMAVVAHPDDESFFMGSTLARYATEGVQVDLVMATRGEGGWGGDPLERPTPPALSALRSRELEQAARVLGIHSVTHLDWPDGALKTIAAAEAIPSIVTVIRRFRPQVIVTFGPDGIYGHPDHVAVAQFGLGAVVCAADAGYTDAEALAPHRVLKVYFALETTDAVKVRAQTLGWSSFVVDGVPRDAPGWPGWMASCTVDGGPHWRATWDALCFHASQIGRNGPIHRLTDHQREALWRECRYYRAFSLVNAGRELEHDLFEGIT